MEGDLTSTDMSPGESLKMWDPTWKSLCWWILQDRVRQSFPILNGTGEKQRMDSYQCMICGHIYDPGKGEPSMNILAGTDFKDLPSGWRCPVCQATPDKFRIV